MDKPYDVLGLSPYVSEDEARKKYLSLCKKYHPDSANGDSVMFMKIQSAWEELKTYGSNAFGKEEKVVSHSTLFSFKRV